MFIERVEGLAEAILRNFDLHPPDAMIVFSAGGTTAVPIEMAMGARTRGLPVVAVTAVEASRQSRSGHSSGTRLLDHADVVLDLCTPPGDALVAIAGLDTPVGPGSTIAAVALANELKVRTRDGSACQRGAATGASPARPSWGPSRSRRAVRRGLCRARAPPCADAARRSLRCERRSRRQSPPRRSSMQVSRKLSGALMALALAAVVAACGSGSDDSSSGSSGSSGSGNKKYTIGVTNTLVGNGWREEMICAVKAQAARQRRGLQGPASPTRTAPPPSRSPAIRNLISSGANAIIVNPADATALNPVIKRGQAARHEDRRAVDQAVDCARRPTSSPTTRTPTAARRASGWPRRWAARATCSRCAASTACPADADRHKGFMEAIEAEPGHQGRQGDLHRLAVRARAASRRSTSCSSGTKIDGIWTSGIDYSVVNALKTAGKRTVPVVGADNNKFIGQLLDGAPGAAVTNPAAIGGVGAAIAIDALAGQEPEARDARSRPQVWDIAEQGGPEQEVLRPERCRRRTRSQLSVKPYTTYTNDQLSSCQGP